MKRRAIWIGKRLLNYGITGWWFRHGTCGGRFIPDDDGLDGVNVPFHAMDEVLHFQEEEL